MKLTKEYFENHPQWEVSYELVKGLESDGSDDVKLWNAHLHNDCNNEEHVGLVDLYVSNCMYDWRFALHGELNGSDEGFFSGTFFACTVEELETLFKICHFDTYQYTI